MEYLPDSGSFLLEDGVSLGALFELTPVGSEARTPAFMRALRDAIQTAIAEAIPELDEAPWVLQFYVQDDPSLAELVEGIGRYAPGRYARASIPGTIWGCFARIASGSAAPRACSRTRR